MIKENLSSARRLLAATSVIDSVTGKQYAVFAGGYSNGYSNTIDAFCITNGVISDKITGALSKGRNYLSATTVTSVVTNTQYAVFVGGYDGNHTNIVDTFCIINGVISN